LNGKHCPAQKNEEKKVEHRVSKARARYISKLLQPIRYALVIFLRGLLSCSSN
jgi:hypothetical protein